MICRTQREQRDSRCFFFPFSFYREAKQHPIPLNEEKQEADENNKNKITIITKKLSAWCIERRIFECGDLGERYALHHVYNNMESQLSSGETFGLAASTVVITREKGKSRSQGTIAPPGFMKQFMLAIGSRLRFRPAFLNLTENSKCPYVILLYQKTL